VAPRQESRSTQNEALDLRRALRNSLGIFIFGVVSAALLRQWGVLESTPVIYYYFFALYEFYQLALLVVLGSMIWCLLDKRFDEIGLRILETIYSRSAPIFIAWTAGILFWGTSVGTVAVFRWHEFSMDECMANFQAIIFSHGMARAPVPEEWQPFAHGLRVHFSLLAPDHSSWMSAYWPAYAWIRSLFSPFGAEWFTNPLLAAMSMVVLAATVPHVVPDCPSARLVAVLMFVASAQFWVTSMTAYSMPAHLFFNLLWLFLYLKRQPFCSAVLPWVGLVAILLHKPNVHLLWAFPFFVRMLLQRRWGLLFYACAVYLFAVWLVLQWRDVMAFVDVSPPVAASEIPSEVHRAWSASSVVEALEIPRDIFDIWLRALTIPLEFGWQALAVTPFVLIALGSWRRLTDLQRDLFWSLLLLWLFYVVFRSSQIHGWGFRYVYPALGNLILLATVGWAILQKSDQANRAAVLLGASLAVAAFFQIPLRAWQAYDAVTPQIHGLAFLRNQQADIVWIDTRKNWYAIDLVKNDPFLRNRPKLMARERLSEHEIEALKRKYRVREVSPEELAAVGIPETPLALDGEAKPRNNL